MTLRDDFRDDLQNVLLDVSEAAVEITYTPAGGAAQIVAAFVSPVEQTLDEGDEASSVARRITVTIPTSSDAAPSGTTAVADPAVGDQVAHDSQTYAVTRIIERTDAVARLECEQVARKRLRGEHRPLEVA